MIALMVIAMFVTTGCKNVKPNTEEVADSDTIVEEIFVFPDTTIYGICGEGSTMHTLELVTDEDDTLTFLVDDEEMGAVGIVGGLIAGDRIAVVGHRVGDELITDRAVNLTTLVGKWTSLDKNFEMMEGGVVSSHVKAEAYPWTTWKICNGYLLLNKDTFSVVELGADSLFLENDKGIFTYKRQS